MKLRLAEFLAVASCKFTFANPRARYQQLRVGSHEVEGKQATHQDLELSAKGVLQNVQQRQAPNQNEEQSDPTLEVNTDVGILVDNDEEDSKMSFSKEHQDQRSGRILTSLHQCQGDQACDDAIILSAGNNTCNGYRACLEAGRSGNFTIGYDSCLEANSCEDAARYGVFDAGNGACVGYKACYEGARNGTFQASDGSCVGTWACREGGHQGSFQAGRQSCVGPFSCREGGERGRFQAGNFSCLEFGGCGKAGFYGNFSLGGGSCQGLRACYDTAYYGSFTAGYKSCLGNFTCNQGANKGAFHVGNGACLELKACFRTGFMRGSNFTAGDGSCVGEESCQYAAYNGVVILGDASCTGTAACTPRIRSRSVRNDFSIGSKSCTCDGCCENLMHGSRIGDCQCTKLTDGCSNQTIPVDKPGSCLQEASSKEMDLQYQSLTFDNSTNELGLTQSDVKVKLGHLVNEDDNEIQELIFDNSTNQLRLTNSSGVVDLSHLYHPPQQLEFDDNTQLLRMTDSQVGVKLPSPKLDLSMHNGKVELSAAEGISADLSSLRVVALQASIDDLDKRQTFKYGGKATKGWSVLSSGRLVGMSITANCGLKEGTLEIRVVDCTNTKSVQFLGSSQDKLALQSRQGRSDTIKFATPIPIKAGAILCFDARRVGKVDSDDKDNAASLVLMLEQV